MIKYFTINLLKLFDYYYQKKLFNFLKKKGLTSFDIFFDVGAHRGESIKLFSKNFDIKNIYSFEPSKNNFEALKNNLKKIKKKNKKINITIENLALGENDKDIKIKYLSESSSSTINEIDIDSKYFKKKSIFLYKKKK